jgi:hypothetical protein
LERRDKEDGNRNFELCLALVAVLRVPSREVLSWNLLA